jgi:surface antigen
METRMAASTRSMAWSFLVLALACGNAAAQSNLTFMKDSPVSRFNAEDMRLMQEAGKAVLDSTEPSATREWSNPKSKHSGKVTLEQTFSFESRDCRRLRVENRAGGMQSNTLVPVCRNAQGRWAVDTRARPAS